MYDHQNGYHNLQLSVLRALYTELEAKYRAALYAQVEGVFELTIRSQTQTISIALDGMEVSQMVIEAISDRLSRVERDMRWHSVELGDEVKGELKQDREVEAAREAASKAAWDEYERQRQGLAHMAAASAAPPQRPVGRPRKPKPEVMAAAGALAAQVPMNHGGTGLAVSRATTSTQG